MALSGIVASAEAAGLKSDEQVVLFPTLGWQVRDGWELEIHGCVFEPERRRLLTAVLRKALGIDDDKLSAAEMAIWRERSQFFLVDNERGKEISLRLGDQIHRLATSQANGHFQGRIQLAGNRSSSIPELTNGILRFEIASNAKATRPFTGAVHLLAATGLSVISDIDDTIKVSQVRDRQEMLQNTFVRPFQPVPGMANLYHRWSDQGAQFHYVSASPWQLYVPLAEFVRSNGFPAGTFHLKNFRMKDETFFDLFKSPERYKPAVIGPLLARFPQRRFVLVGDSGEKDPEIYARLARQYPRQVVRILVRDVTGQASASPRYRQTFKGLPGELWRIFKEPSEIETALPAGGKN